MSLDSFLVQLVEHKAVVAVYKDKNLIVKTFINAPWKAQRQEDSAREAAYLVMVARQDDLEEEGASVQGIRLPHLARFDRQQHHLAQQLFVGAHHTWTALHHACAQAKQVFDSAGVLLQTFPVQKGARGSKVGLREQDRERGPEKCTLSSTLTSCTSLFRLRTSDFKALIKNR